MADLEFSFEDALASCAWNIREWFCSFQVACREAGAKVLQNLVELSPYFVPSPAINLSLKSPGA